MCERFNIDDVARINNIQIIHERGGETFAVYPFCGNKTGKFSYIVSKGTKKNIYHCFSCEAKGNAIDLHIKLSGENFGEGEQAYKLAAKDIFKRLGSGFHAERFNRWIGAFLFVVLRIRPAIFFFPVLTRPRKMFTIIKYNRSCYELFVLHPSVESYKAF